MQEQSRQTLLPGLKLSYDHPHFWAADLLCSLFAELHDHIGAGVHAERAAVEADVIILCLPPDAARVVLIIDLALLVLLGETLLRCLLRLAVALDDAAGAAGHVGTDEHMQTVLPVAQDIVRAAADDDALALFCQLLDDLALRDIELIVHGEVVVAVALGRGQIEQQAVAGVGIFAVLLDVLRRKAAALCDLIDQLAVIERIAELLCDLLADAAAAAAEFTADRNDILHDGFPPFFYIQPAE